MVGGCTLIGQIGAIGKALLCARAILTKLRVWNFGRAFEIKGRQCNNRFMYNLNHCRSGLLSIVRKGTFLENSEVWFLGFSLVHLLYLTAVFRVEFPTGYNVMDLFMALTISEKSAKFRGLGN